MFRRRNMVLWAGIFLILLLAIVLIYPLRLNLELFRQTIEANLSRLVRGDVQYEGAHLSLFPRPRVVFDKATVSVRGEASGRIQSVAVYPRILPLFAGKLQVARIGLRDPDITVRLEPRRPRDKKSLERFDLSELRDRVASLMTNLSHRVPALTIAVRNGNLDLVDGERTVFRFQHIKGRVRFPPNQFKVHVQCRSNLWEEISLDGDFQSGDFSSVGNIELTRFRPKPVMDYLAVNGVSLLDDSLANLDLSFKTERLKVLDVELRGSLPLLTLLQDGKERLAIKAGGFNATLHVDETEIKGLLREWTFDYPKISISGEFSRDVASQASRLALKGKNVEIQSVRQVVLAVLGGNDTAQDIFEVLQGGHVPLITFVAYGNSQDPLGEFEKMLLKGTMANGKLFIPQPDLHLTEVNGSVTLSQGVLKGEDLSARLGNSEGSKGALTLGFVGPHPPFHLDILIKADLGQLPPILKRVVKNETFLKELSLIEEFRGKGLGRLILGELRDDIDARVSVSELNIFADYKRLPYPVRLESGQFFYGPTEVRVSNLTGRMGTSAFSGLSGSVNWEKEHTIKIPSAASRISLDEIFPWLVSHEELKEALRRFKSAKGFAEVSLLDLDGPLLEPGKWSFRATGDLEQVVLESTLFPGPLTVVHGQYEAAPQTFSFTNAQASVLDASLNASGKLTGHLGGLRKADLTLNGGLGPKAVQWISEVSQLPSPLRIRPPLSLRDGKFVWEMDKETAFSGTMDVNKGPRVSLDLLVRPKDVVVKDLRIGDAQSQAAFSFKVADRIVDLKFAGSLTQATLDNLLVENPFLSGRIRGDLGIHLVIDQVGRSTAQGTLEGEGIGRPWRLELPLEVERFSLRAAKDRVTVESADLTYSGSRMSLTGDVNVAPEGFVVDMDLTSNGFGWEHLKEMLDREGTGNGGQRREELYRQPIRGNLRVRSANFKYDDFTWEPVDAQVSLDPRAVRVTINTANVCGVSTPGVVNVLPNEVQMRFTPTAAGGSMDAFFECLWDRSGLAQGAFDLKGQLAGQGKSDEVIQAMQGDLDFSSSDGHIYRYGILAKVFTVLNVTEVFRGRLPDVVREGFHYDSIEIKANLHDGILQMKEGTIKSSSINMIWQGNVDLVNKKIDVTVLVTLLRTVDDIIKSIPVFGDILGRNFISVPVKVTGELSDPTVVPLSPSAVGAELLGIVERTLKLPFKLIQPLLPR